MNKKTKTQSFYQISNEESILCFKKCYCSMRHVRLLEFRMSNFLQKKINKNPVVRRPIVKSTLLINIYLFL